VKGVRGVQRRVLSAPGRKEKRGEFGKTQMRRGSLGHLSVGTGSSGYRNGLGCEKSRAQERRKIYNKPLGDSKPADLPTVGVMCQPSPPVGGVQKFNNKIKKRQLKGKTGGSQGFPSIETLKESSKRAGSFLGGSLW